MAWFKKKPMSTTEIPIDGEPSGVGDPAPTGGLSFRSTSNTATTTDVVTPPTDQTMPISSHSSISQSGGLQHQSSHPVQAHKSFGESVHHAKEETMSGAGVATLVLWTLAVTGWTGFQVVQNALWNATLPGYDFPFQTAAAGAPVYQNIGDPSINREVNAIWLMVAVESAITVTFFVLALALLVVPAVQACRQGTRARRMKRSFLVWLLTMALVATAWFKVFIISSMWNKMEYQNMFCSGDNLDLKYTFNPTEADKAAGCTLAPCITPMRMGLVFALLTIGFHMLMYFWHQPKGACAKMLVLIPAILLVAALLLKPVTAMMNFRYTQLFYTTKGNFTFTGEMIVALIEFVTAVWLSLYMGWAASSLRLLNRFTNTLLGCCGREYEDIYYEREESMKANKGHGDPYDAAEAGEGEAPTSQKTRRSYSLRAASKSMLQQYYYMTQLPTVFGFISPMITYFSLGVQNWWIVFDIIVGAAFVFIYMLLCAGHRKILAPSKH